MKNKMSDLRDHLFMALEGLSDKENPMDIERAKAISDVAQTIVNSAKVEADFYKVTGVTPPPTTFLLTADANQTLGVITHTLK